MNFIVSKKTLSPELENFLSNVSKRAQLPC